jgi:hypothetical protein
VILVKDLFLLFHEWQQYCRMSIARIAARNENVVDFGQLSENLTPFFQRRFNGLFVGP